MDEKSAPHDDVTAVVHQIAEDFCHDMGPLARHSRLDGPTDIDAWVDQQFAHYHGRLAALGLWGRDNQVPSGILWKLAGHLLALGSLQWHAHEKPRGYAGDFEMLAKICGHVQCGHPLGGAFDRFFQRQAAPQAVRNRTALMADQIVRRVVESQHPQRVVSIGSGPAIDVQMALERLADQQRPTPEIHLLDIDPHALEFASRALEAWIPSGPIHAHRVNLLRLPKQKRRLGQLAGADLIFCTGLFDYLSHSDAVAMLQAMWHSLGPGGELFAFNFSPHNPSRTYMEWIGNWYLTHRSVGEMEAIGADAGLPWQDRCVDFEPTGVNLFVHARRSGAGHVGRSL